MSPALMAPLRTAVKPLAKAVSISNDALSPLARKNLIYGGKPALFSNFPKIGVLRGFLKAADLDRDERLTRLAAGGISTLPPFADQHPEKALPHARQALISAGIIEEERRRSKTAGLARSFRLDRALNKAEHLGTTTPKLLFDQSVAAGKVQRRTSRVVEKAVASGDMSGYERLTQGRGMKEDQSRRWRMAWDPFTEKRAAFWRPKMTFPYQGDLKRMALNPESGITGDSREILLDEHYRRMSAEPRRNIGEAAVLGGLTGAAFGGAVTGLRALGGLRGAGAPWGHAFRGSLGAAAGGAAIGAAIGIPTGVVKGHVRNREIGRAQMYTGSSPQARKQLVRSEVGRSLG